MSCCCIELPVAASLRDKKPLPRDFRPCPLAPNLSSESTPSGHDYSAFPIGGVASAHVTESALRSRPTRAREFAAVAVVPSFRNAVDVARASNSERDAARCPVCGRDDEVSGTRRASRTELHHNLLVPKISHSPSCICSCRWHNTQAIQSVPCDRRGTLR